MSSQTNVEYLLRKFLVIRCSFVPYNITVYSLRAHRVVSTDIIIKFQHKIKTTT